ncbi:MAG: radical SAM protein, partial [Candidatus Altiarchaeales archaeon]|nr:radical SAM protein [Candidatus Altiarchaeales archaeon]
INKRKFMEAQDPNQAAISLSGEPTIYPRISELIEEFKKRGFTTFLVSNGTFPERFMDMTPPTQLYISIDAPDKKTYKRVCNPIVHGTWEKINRSLELLPSLDTRTVIRITLVKGLNDINLEGYAKLISKAEPDFIEVKAFMLLGGSRARLSLENMPSFEYVEEFSGRLSAEVGYGVADTSVDSRVVLLSKTDKAYIPIPPKD